MVKRNNQVLIITHSLALQQGLAALLESLPDITAVKSVGDIATAYRWIAAQQPQVVLLDAATFGRDTPAILERICILSPKTQRLLLVDTVQELNAVHQNVERVIIKGAIPSTVAEVVMNLLSTERDHNGRDS